jgi:hypothetical protein
MKLAIQEEIIKYHVRPVVWLESKVIGWELILDENKEPIPLGYCICFAYEPGECCCRTSAWDNYVYVDD